MMSLLGLLFELCFLEIKGAYSLHSESPALKIFLIAVFDVKDLTNPFLIILSMEAGIVHFHGGKYKCGTAYHT